MGKVKAETRTIDGWLAYAKRKKFAWADAAIKNADALGNRSEREYFLTENYERLSAALRQAFSWKSSPEQFMFWYKIYCELVKTEAAQFPANL